MAAYLTRIYPCQKVSLNCGFEIVRRSATAAGYLLSMWNKVNHMGVSYDAGTSKSGWDVRPIDEINEVDTAKCHGVSLNGFRLCQDSDYSTAEKASCIDDHTLTTATGSWSVDINLDIEGAIRSIQFYMRGSWSPSFTEETWGLYSPSLMEGLPGKARQYFMIRAIFRGLPAKRANCWNEHELYVRAYFALRRHSRRSKIIPAFEDYCRQIGFACVDDPGSPVVRIPDFVPTGPVYPSIGSVDD